MKQKILLKTMLLLCALVAGSTSVWGDDTYVKVTSAAGLEASAEYLLVYENDDESKALGAITGGSTKYGSGVDVTVSDSKITITTEAVAVLTMEASSSNWKLKSSLDDKYLHWSSGNSLTTDATGSAWTISYSGAVATIQHSVTTDRKIKWNSSSPRFACYTTPQTDVALYKKQAAKTPIATDVSIADPGTLAKGAKDAFTGTSTDAAACTKVWSTSDASIIDITNTTTGDYEAKGRGTATITYTITPDDATNYSTVYAERNVSVTEPVVVTASDVVMTYGAAPTAIGATPSPGYAGTLGYTSGNINIATVDGSGNVTAVAVGTTTITISATADAVNLYDVGNKVINVTVNAPTGSTTFSSEVNVFYESFDTNEGTGGNDGSWSGSIATSDIKYDNSGWTCSNQKGANYCAKFGSGSGGGSAQTPALGQAGTFTLTFKAGAWNGGSEGTSLSVSASNATLRNADDTEDVSSVTLTKGAWTTYTLTLKNATADAKVTFSTAGANNRFFLDEVKVTKSAPSTATVTLNTSGYATYCSVNPINFSSTTGYTAWRVSNIDADGTITFTKITEAIKGGQGVLLYNKDAGGLSTEATINFANGTTEFNSSENKLKGTTAPKYLTQVDGDYTNFGLKGNEFQKAANGVTIPVNKAYLPVPTSIVDALSSSSVKAFTFVFDDEATGIRTIEKVSVEEAAEIFDLSGRRLNKIQKGINIVNGKKILY